MAFKKATKEQAKARIGLLGPAGSGKSYTALKVASYLGKRVAAIDTEHGSLSKYADEFDFDVNDLTSFHPHNYINAIREAEQGGYDVLVIDSLSHAWFGKDGALELKDRAAAKSNNGNSFTAWREITPLHNSLIDAMLSSRMHIIVTMRVKTEYTLETNDRGKQVPRRIGTAPVQREGMEYEFDIVGDMDIDNTLTVSKTRCRALRGAVVPMPGEEFAKTILTWLTDGEVPERELKLKALNDLNEWASSKGIDGNKLRSYGIDCPDVSNDPRTWMPEDCNKVQTYIEALLTQPKPSNTSNDEEFGFDPASKRQIQRIHILQQEKGISDEVYRAMLADKYRGATSSKQLMVDEANEFIKFLEDYIPPAAMGLSNEKAEGPYPWETETMGAH